MSKLHKNHSEIKRILEALEDAGNYPAPEDPEFPDARHHDLEIESVLMDNFRMVSEINSPPINSKCYGCEDPEAVLRCAGRGFSGCWLVQCNEIDYTNEA